MRLHPVGALLLPHRAAESCEVMDYTIPAGAQVLVNVWAIGRDPAIWGDDSASFRPERFIGSKVDFRGQDFELLPFGSGRRAVGCQAGSVGFGCVGSELRLVSSRRGGSGKDEYE
ncbi:unnamed protein product [Linum tenue]|uniref:Cytochrome P450 n=1 Tax=Linum tenue TaxID=586396 RepID=A0AAV0NAU7_9ROSI|nr:unnamed protein product [Linum tenue]